MEMTTVNARPVEKASELPEPQRTALRELLLTLADNKRILGLRYADWMLGAPTLETGIAASSMAQDEWGHGRLTYALLGDFGDDPKWLEHERDGEGYHSNELLDRKFESWPDFIATALLFDTALAQEYAGLVGSRYTAARNRVQKMLDEEAFHFQYAAGWVERLVEAPATRAQLEQALARVLPATMRWLMGSEQDDPLLASEGLIDGRESKVRLFLARVGPVLDRVGLAPAAGLARQGDEWVFPAALDWSGWDPARRRLAGAPDADTLARARGDRNRAMRLD